MTTLYVNVYRVGRSYGGPEEGGWWFDHGTAIGSIPVGLSESEFAEMRAAAVASHVLAYDSTTGDYNPVLDRVNHEHTDWCAPGDHDRKPDGTHYDFSPRCHEASWREWTDTWVRRLAEREADKWREKFRETGARSSVNGGKDHVIRIESEFASDWSDYEPWS